MKLIAIILALLMNFISVSYSVEWVVDENRTYKLNECKHVSNVDYECTSGDYYYFGEIIIESGVAYPGVRPSGAKKFIKNTILNSKRNNLNSIKSKYTFKANKNNLPVISTILINISEIQSGVFNNKDCLEGPKSQIAKCISDYYRRDDLDRQKAMSWFIEAKNNGHITDESLFLKQLFKEDESVNGLFGGRVKVSFANLVSQYKHLESMHPYHKESFDSFWNWLSERNNILTTSLQKNINSYNGKPFKQSDRDKDSSFSDLWGQYGGSILDSNGEQTKHKSNYTSNALADIKAPIININRGDLITVTSQSISLTGSIVDDSSVSDITINGGLIDIDDSDNFNITMYLGLGDNKFTIEAFDIFGNKSSKTITVVRNKVIVKNRDRKLSPPTIQLASNPNSIALIIGLDDYKTMPRAPWAESDASIFYDYAHNVLGIPLDRIRLITGKESDGIGIWKSLEQWLPSQVDKNKSDIYVYFAGHGLVSEDGKEAYLMPYDGDTSMLSRTAISRKDVISGLDSLKARSVTLFMDTCYSGSAKGGKQVLVASRGLRIVKKSTLADLPSNFTLFSAAANNETAISHPTLENGLFSYWMMRGLGGEADSNNDAKLTNGELHAFISDKVQKTAISKGHSQHPQLVGDKDKVIASW